VSERDVDMRAEAGEGVANEPAKTAAAPAPAYAHELSTDAAHAPIEPREDALRGAPLKTLWTRVSPFLPWISLALSVSGAVLMDRRESRAGIVAAASAGSWIVLVLVTLAHRPKSADAERTGALKKAFRYTIVAANQSLVHVSLFFCAPFYAQAFVFTPLELVFAGLFAVALGVSLWDPLCERVLRHPALGPLLLAFASFCAWNAVLPMLGFSHRVAVWMAAGAVSFALILVHVLGRSDRKHLLGALYVAVGLPLVLYFGGVRALPPAPLHLVEAAIGTRVVNRELVDPTKRFARSPGELVCFTAIRAPHGLNDQLVHEWRHAGKLTHRVAIDVRGGRRAGFRTWSRLPVGPRSSGEYRCDVLTTLGQTLGSVRVVIGP
jgi:hypothetical protein